MIVPYFCAMTISLPYILVFSCLLRCVQSQSPTVIPTVAPTRPATRNMTRVIGTGTNTGTSLTTNGVPATSALVGFCLGIWSDTSGSIYYIDYQGFGYARKVNPNGIINTIGGGTSGFTSGTHPFTTVQMVSDSGIAGNSKYLYATNGNYVYRVNSTNMATIYAGSTSSGSTGNGGPASSAKLSGPKMLYALEDGTLYIADTGNSIIRVVSPAGIISTAVGSPTPSSGFSGDGGPPTSTNVKLSSCYGVYVDTIGQIFFTDSSNARVRYVNSANILNTYAGGGSTSGDGILGTAAKLSTPLYAIGGDLAGNIYFISSTTIRMIDYSTKLISTFINTNYKYTRIVSTRAMWIDTLQSLMYYGGTNAVATAPIFDASSSTPSQIPILAPSLIPSVTPSAGPTTLIPSVIPSFTPSANPTTTPSLVPSESPTASPTATPSLKPSNTPTVSPSAVPTAIPSGTYPPSQAPTIIPTTVPSIIPTAAPSLYPTLTPTAVPSIIPTSAPTMAPTTTPTTTPPSHCPTIFPSEAPSFAPSGSYSPTQSPTISPSALPTLAPTTSLPSFIPTFSPTTAYPTATPTVQIKEILEINGNYQFTLYNVASVTDITNTSIQTILTTIANVSDVLSENQVKIVDIVESNIRRSRGRRYLLQELSPIHNLDLSSIQATVEATSIYNLIDYPGITAQILFKNMTTRIQTAIDDGSMVTFIRQLAVANNASQLLDADITAVVFSENILKPPATSSSKSHSDVGLIIGVIIGIFAFFLILIGCCYWILRKSNRRHAVYVVNDGKEID